MSQPSFLKNVALRFVFTIPLRFSGLIILPLLTRLYSKEIYGAWLQVIIISEMLSNILGLQLGSAIVRYLTGENHPIRKVKAVLTITFACCTFFIIITFVFGNYISVIVFGDGKFKSVLIVASVWISIKALMRIGLSVLRAKEKISTLSSREFISTLWLIAAVSGSYLFGLKIESLIVICLTGDAILLIWILFQIQVHIPFIKISESFFEIRKYFPFAIPLIFGTLFLWSTRSIDRFLIVHLMDLDSVGTYGVSMQVSNLLSVVLNPINFVLFPRVAESWNRKSSSEVNFYFSQAVTLTLVSSAPIIVGLFIVSDTLVPLIAGQDYLTTKGLIGFLLLSGLAGMIYQNHLYVINLMEKNYLLPILFITTAILNFLFCYFLILKFEILGAAIGRFLTSAIMAFIITYWARKYIKFILPWDKILKAAMISLIMGVSIFWMPMNTWLQLFTVVTAGVITFSALMFFFKIITFEKISIFKICF